MAATLLECVLQSRCAAQVRLSGEDLAGRIFQNPVQLPPRGPSPGGPIPDFRNFARAMGRSRGRG